MRVHYALQKQGVEIEYLGCRGVGGKGGGGGGGGSGQTLAMPMRALSVLSTTIIKASVLL